MEKKRVDESRFSPFFSSATGRIPPPALFSKKGKIQRFARALRFFWKTPRTRTKI
jgi:hypothetical protein